ncbi:MAG: patatin-like phospholipase family protein [Pseudomonadota bacterium]
MEEQGIPIHLVLGSGGARGLTHIGVVRVLREHGYSVKSITGCSMGALVGALLVTDHLDEYEQWVKQLSRWDVFRFLDISLLGRAGMVKGDKLMEQLGGWLTGVEMSELDIPLTVVAADLLTRREVWIKSGDLLEAVRASIAVPGVFTPHVTHGRVLVDGGILNPLPIPHSGLDTTTITVAVSLSGREVTHPFGEHIAVDEVGELADENSPIAHELEADLVHRSSEGAAIGTENKGTENASEAVAEGDTNVTGGKNERERELLAAPEANRDEESSFLDSLTRFFGRERKSPDPLERIQEEAHGLGYRQRLGASRPALTDVMLGMFNTMQDTIARHQLAGNPPDILIDIPCNICESHEFHRADELIRAGEYWARRALADQNNSSA